MVESLVSSELCEVRERHALIIANSQGKPTLPPDFIKRAEVVEEFTKKYNFTDVTVLKDKQATKKAIEEFFKE